MTLERSVGVVAGVFFGLGALYYLYAPRIKHSLGHDEPPSTEAPAPAPKVSEPAAPQYPVPEAPAPPAPAEAQANAPAPSHTLPRSVDPGEDLVASDPVVRESVAKVFGADFTEVYLIPDRVIQNVVTTVDSLDRDPVPLRFRALVNVPEVPLVDHAGDRITLSPQNAERYRVPMAALKAADAKTIASLYLHYYPLFQRAYRELGYPNGYFNDRVIAIIDHLLATPEVEGPIELVQPKVLYQFADPELEQLSSGQKILVRIGLENEAIVKGKLRELRTILAARGKAKGEAPQRS